MSNKFPDRGNFIIPQSILDEADWVIDSFIDSLGKNCLLIYPPIVSECTNCYFDIDAQHSSNIYKSGGSVIFNNGDICPVCGGDGRQTLPQRETIKLRVYWSQKDWVKIAVPKNFVNIPNDIVQIIGYMSDLNKIEQAQSIILDSDLGDRWLCKRSGQAVPWGFQRRYFVQFLERIVDSV